MAARFTWHEKFTRVADKLPEDLQGEFVLAVIRYGTYGEEPDLEYPLSAIFESIREDVDYSVNAIKNGSLGGRGKKKKEGNSGEETPLETPLKTPLSNDENPTLETAKPPFEAKTRQDITRQDITRQDNKGARFTPPTPEQVSTYAKTAGITLNAERFCDFYASKGWKVGSSSMKDWKAAARNWAARDKPKEVTLDAEAEFYASLV